MRGRKWLVANLTIEQSIYNFWPRTHSHRLVERLAVGAFKLIVEHSTSSGRASAATTGQSSTHGAGYLRARSSCSLSFCSAMNRLITVNSYTMLASTIMIAIAKKLMMLMTALLFSQHGEKAPAINGQGL
jgi:hypothetical protein